MRSSKKRSLLYVNEHFESERNDKVALLDSFIFITAYSGPTRTLQVEAIVIHNLNPSLHEVANELLAVVILGIVLAV